MRKWEDIVKDKMEEFDETLPESVFVEFHAMRNGAAPDPAPKRFPLVWALVPAAYCPGQYAEGNQTPRFPPTKDGRHRDV